MIVVKIIVSMTLSPKEMHWICHNEIESNRLKRLFLLNSLHGIFQSSQSLQIFCRQWRRKEKFCKDRKEKSTEILVRQDWGHLSSHMDWPDIGRVRDLASHWPCRWLQNLNLAVNQIEMCVTGNPLRDCKDRKKSPFYVAEQIEPIA